MDPMTALVEIETEKVPNAGHPYVKRNRSLRRASSGQQRARRGWKLWTGPKESNTWKNMSWRLDYE
jgi:hypothetical protein